MGIQDAEHEETAPGAPRLLITKLACSLVGKTETIKISPDSRAYEAYSRGEVREQFQCNYGFNPVFRDDIGRTGLKVTGVDLQGQIRIVEITAHRFYIATLFLPQISSRPENPHPLIVAYLKAAMAFQRVRRNIETEV